jgi:hypothetical protein
LLHILDNISDLFLAQQEPYLVVEEVQMEVEVFF